LKLIFVLKLKHKSLKVYILKEKKEVKKPLVIRKEGSKDILKGSYILEGRQTKAFS